MEGRSDRGFVIIVIIVVGAAAFVFGRDGDMFFDRGRCRVVDGFVAILR